MEDKQFASIAKALADPRRFEIFKLIVATHEMSCGTIAERFPIGQSTVSHHLKLLADAGLIDVRREGQRGYFTASPRVLEAYVEDLRQRLIPTSVEQKARA